MNRREETIRLWFDMWLQKSDLGILNIFSENAVYTESWGPEYHSAAKKQQESQFTVFLLHFVWQGR